MNPKPKTLADIGEREFLRRVEKWFGIFGDKDISLGIGDDCCVLKPSAAPTLLSTDALIEGVHFRRDWMDARSLGSRALAVNLSDLAAMAARPVAALVSLGVPPDTKLKELTDFFMGLREMTTAHACPLAGGDLTRAEKWTVGVTVAGRPAVKHRIIQRNTARPGMMLYATGQPGESAGGCAALLANRHKAKLYAFKLVARHFTPTPRLAEAKALAKACANLAMLDLSDGIWNDAGQMAEASRVGIEIVRDALPVSAAMREAALRLGVDPLDWALFGGESCELLFATDTPLPKIEAAFKRAKIETPLRAIGRIVRRRRDQPAVRALDASGDEIAVENKTFMHFGGDGK